MAIIWCFLRSRLQDRGLSGGRGQRAEQRRQQPGLPPQAAEEEGHQILHRTAVWQEGERQDGTYGTQTRHARSARWAVRTCYRRQRQPSALVSIRRSFRQRLVQPEICFVGRVSMSSCNETPKLQLN